MTEDLSIFFNPEEFATAATHGATPATVLYDENGSILEQLGVQSSSPAALCPTTQWPTLAEGDALSIDLPAGATAFVVRSVQPLDDGALKLITLARP